MAEDKTDTHRRYIFLEGLKMTYRPPEQSLESPCSKIIEGVDEFINAARERIDNNDEWQSWHINELTRISMSLLEMRTTLAKLKAENW